MPENESRVRQVSASPPTCVALSRARSYFRDFGPYGGETSRGVSIPLVRPAPGLGTGRPLWVHAPAPTEAPRATGTDYATSLMALSFALSFANVVARIEWYERPLHAGEHVLSPSNPVIPEV